MPPNISSTTMAQSREYVDYANSFPQNPFEEINWIYKCPQMATPIQTQRSCGGSWAISCATVIGYLIFLYRFNEFGVSLSWEEFSVSAQQLLDRVILYYREFHHDDVLDTQGCYGSYNPLAYTFCRDHGLPQELRDPFVGQRQYAPIVFGAHEYPRFKISDYENLGAWSDSDRQKSLIVNALLEQPLVAIINSTKEFENFNGKGVYGALPNLPNQEKSFHSVVVVAVNTLEDYFIIRNSWSRFWGKFGYAKVKCSELSEFSRPLPPVRFIRAPSGLARVPPSP